MKALILKAIFSLAIVFTISSCSSDDDNNSSNTFQDVVEETIQSGNWRITKYIDSGDDETSDYNGYNFTFNSDNSLVATNGTNTYNGTWSITDSNSSDDSLDDLDFNILFATPPDFEELSDDWDILSRTDSKIELIDISSGNGGTDYLTFEKN